MFISDMEGIVLMIWNTKWIVFTVYSNMMKCWDMDCFSWTMVAKWLILLVVMKVMCA
jgi:hypothetical protein